MIFKQSQNRDQTLGERPARPAAREPRVAGSREVSVETVLEWLEADLEPLPKPVGGEAVPIDLSRGSIRPEPVVSRPPPESRAGPTVVRKAELPRAANASGSAEGTDMNLACSGKTRVGGSRGEVGPRAIDALEDESLRRVMAFARRKRRIAWLLFKATLLLALWSAAAALLAVIVVIVWQDIPPLELGPRVRLLLNR